MDRSIEELRGILARRDQFLATVVHELRNPLAPIAGAVELLGKCGDAQPGVCRARGVLQRQLRLLTRVVDDLADVAQIARGHLELHREIIDLADVVETAVETARPLIDARQHRLTINVPQSVLMVRADELRLSQVIANLLINAAKYTRIGGCIGVSGESEQGMATLRVRDNGVGIEPDMLQQIFEPFTRAPPRSETVQAGFGIGLAVARHLIELHGGSIRACSDGLDHGSEFAISLPIALRCHKSCGISASEGRSWGSSTA